MCEFDTEIDLDTDEDLEGECELNNIGEASELDSLSDLPDVSENLDSTSDVSDDAASDLSTIACPAEYDQNAPASLDEFESDTDDLAAIECPVEWDHDSSNSLNEWRSNVDDLSAVEYPTESDHDLFNHFGETENTTDSIDEVFGCDEESIDSIQQIGGIDAEYFPEEFLDDIRIQNPEYAQRIDDLIESGAITLEFSDEITASEDQKVLTREYSQALQESYENDTQETLANIRESLLERGVNENVIENFLTYERDRIDADHESDLAGKTSIDIHSISTDWDEKAEILSDPTMAQAEEFEGTLGDNSSTDVSSIDSNAEAPTGSYDIETETAEIPEIQIVNEQNQSEEIDENIDAPEPTIISDIGDITRISDIKDEGIQDIAINYDEIYDEISREALSEGFSNVDIYRDIERLDNSLDNFEDSKWEQMALNERKESLSNLAEYVKESIGFKNPPAIEYYNNPVEGDYASYRSSENVLRINEYMLYNSAEAADTIAHELWHAHQRECAENPQSARDYQYLYNFEHYIKPELSHEAYENQLLEAEARAFSSQLKERLAQIRGGK